MGWCSGSEIYDKVIEAARDAIPDDFVRTKFHLKVIEAFQDRDWDCEDDCRGQDDAFDNALNLLNGEPEDEDEDY